MALTTADRVCTHRTGTHLCPDAPFTTQDAAWLVAPPKEARITPGLSGHRQHGPEKHTPINLDELLPSQCPIDVVHLTNYPNARLTLRKTLRLKPARLALCHHRPKTPEPPAAPPSRAVLRQIMQPITAPYSPVTLSTGAPETGRSASGRIER